MDACGVEDSNCFQKENSDETVAWAQIWINTAVASSAPTVIGIGCLCGMQQKETHTHTQTHNYLWMQVFIQMHLEFNRILRKFAKENEKLCIFTHEQLQILIKLVNEDKLQGTQHVRNEYMLTSKPRCPHTL